MPSDHLREGRLLRLTPGTRRLKDGLEKPRRARRLGLWGGFTRDAGDALPRTLYQWGIAPWGGRQRRSPLFVSHRDTLLRRPPFPV